MTAPSVVVLDLGGVVGRWLPDRRTHELARLSGQPIGLVEQLVFESGFDDAGERGRFDLAAFIAELAALLGLTPGPTVDEALRAAWALAYDPDPAVIRIVTSSPLRTALLTNNGPLMEAALDAELVGIGSVFDQLLFSWRLGATKPDPEAFRLATEALGVEPAAVWFADDSAANVDAARAVGWQAHRYTTALDLQAALPRP